MESFIGKWLSEVDSMDICVSTGEQKYELSLTNLEVRVMFQKLIKGWFGRTNGASDEFVDALLNGDIKAMNYYMNKIALATFSYFDVGNKPSEYIEPERFLPWLCIRADGRSERGLCDKIKQGKWIWKI